MKKLSILMLVATLIAAATFPPLALADEKDPQSTTSGTASGTPSDTPSGIPSSEIGQVLDDYAAGFLGTVIPGASVVVVKDGEILLSRSYGYADVANAVPVDEDTVFPWASITKLLVWTSVMQLVERGDLDLGTDIRSYLPEGFLKKLRFDTPVTMYNLMHHNAGWSTTATDLFTSSPEKFVSLELALLACEPRQIHEPGTVVAYSNYGAALAGYIVECIAGQPFYEYVNENIFSILNINSTALHPYQADNPSVAEKRGKTQGYMLLDGKLLPSPLGSYYMMLYPAGGAVGPASDLAKFLAALMPVKGKPCLLFKNENTLDEMLSLSATYGEGIPGIAHGFFEEFYHVRTRGHSGSLIDFASRLIFSPESGLGFIAMVNVGEHSFNSGIALTLFGEYVPEEHTGMLPDIRKLNNLEGQYSSTEGQIDEGFTKLIAQLQTSPPQNRIQVVDENTLQFLGVEFKQIRPYVFTDDTTSLTLHIQVEGSDVTRVLLVTKTAAVMTAGAVVQFIPQAGSAQALAYVSSVLLVVIVIYLVVAFFLIVIGAIRNRAKKRPSSLVKKLNVALNLFGLAALLNYLIALIRIGQIALHSELMPHFVLNIVYIVFAPVCGILIFWRMRKTELSRGSKLFCIVSSVVAICFAVLMIIWEFYS